MKPVTIVTSANLGAKTNYKTAGVTPLIEALQARQLLERVFCLIHKDFWFRGTRSVLPLWYRVLRRVLKRNVWPGLPDWLASRLVPATSLVLLHPAAQFPRTQAQAKRQGSQTVGIATVAHPHSEAALYEREFARFAVPFTAQAHFRMLAAAVDALDYVVAYSEFVRATYVAAGWPAERVLVAYSDIPPVPVPPARMYDGRLRFLCLGHMTPRKGLHYLLEAWEQANLANAELQIVGGYGNGQYTPAAFQDYCDEIIARNPSISWVGPVRDTVPHYQAAHVFVYPSLSEGNPKVVMEALAHGLPVITTKAAQSMVVDGVNGHIVPERDVACLIRQLKRSNAERERLPELSRAARQAMAKKTPFTETVASWCEALLQQSATTRD